MSNQAQDSTAPATQPAEQANAPLAQATVDASQVPEWAEGLLSVTTKLAGDVSALKERSVSQENNGNGDNGTPTTPDAGTQPAEQSTPSNGEQRLFTQAELGQQLSAARKAEREKFEARMAELEAKIATPAKPAEPSKPAKKTKTDNSDDPPEYVSALLSEIKGLKETVTALQQDTTASKFEQAFKASGLPASMRDFAEAAVKGSNATDIAAYLEAMKVNVPAAAPAKETQASTPASQSSVQAVSPLATPADKPTGKTDSTPDEPMPGGTPSAKKDFSGVIDPTTLSAEDVAHLTASGEFHPLLERWRRHGHGAGGMSLFPKKKLR